MNILVVEDNLVSRKMLSKVLSKAGYHILEAENGLNALEIMQLQNIDLVITDLMMPKMDGLALLTHIRSLKIAKYIYIIVLTAKDDKQNLIHLLETGADDYLTKPFNPGELLARIKTGERIVQLEQKHKNLLSDLIGSRNKVRVIFDSLTEEIVTVNEDYEIVSVNKKFMAENYCQYADIVGKKIIERINDNSYLFGNSTLTNYIKKVFDRGVQQTFSDLFQKSPDKKIYKRITCTPIKDAGNKTIQVLIVVTDLTEEMENTIKINSLNDQLQETIKRLKETRAQFIQSEKMASIGQLAAGVAHEINNPTGFVSSNLKTLSEYINDLKKLIRHYQQIGVILNSDLAQQPLIDGLRQKNQEIQSFEQKIDIDYIMNDLIEIIKDSKEGTDRIKKIVMDLKDFAHPGEDKLQVSDINQCIDSALNIIWNEIKYMITIKKDYATLPMVTCYPHQLNQVFMNLLVNAAQSMKQQGQIEIKTYRENDMVVIEVSDTGEGISEENLTKIYDPFFTTKDVGKGTGLGLNVVYTIIKKHSGSIDARSALGQGTTFTIRIPIAGPAKKMEN